MIERLGIVEDGQRRRAMYGRWARPKVRQASKAGAGAKVESGQSASSTRGFTPVQQLVELASSIKGVPVERLVVRRADDRTNGGLVAARRFTCWFVRERRPDLTTVKVAGLLNRSEQSIMSAVRAVSNGAGKQPYRSWLAHPLVNSRGRSDERLRRP